MERVLDRTRAVVWQDRQNGQAKYARTDVGTALISTHPDGGVLLSLWRADQGPLDGGGFFDTFELAQERAQAILDPRPTFWKTLDDFLSDLRRRFSQTEPQRFLEDLTRNKRYAASRAKGLSCRHPYYP